MSAAVQDAYYLRLCGRSVHEFGLEMVFLSEPINKLLDLLPEFGDVFLGLMTALSGHSSVSDATASTSMQHVSWRAPAFLKFSLK